jgi:ubiquinone/menaquinone biosynthesis C-methylase UbiE
LQNPDRKKMIQQGFDTVAAGYDHPSLSFFPETAKRLIDHLRLRPTDKLLDVCTGTGCVALRAAERLSEGQVTGIDLSSGMLQQAKKTAMDGGNAGNAGTIGSAKFIQMDVDDLSLENLNRPDEFFDVATCSFGLFFLEDMTKGLSNIAKTVRPGGKVAITSFTGEAFAPFADIFIKHFEATGRTVPPLSWKRLATEELIREQFDAADINKVEIHHEPLGYHMTSSQIWWDVVWNAGWRSLLNQLSEEEQQQFQKNHLNEINEVIGDEGLWFNTEVMIAVGEMPTWT